MSSRRIERLSESVKQEVSKIILYELKDPRISFITVTHVEISPDLRNAKVHVSILGDNTTQTKTLRGLEHAKGFIQTELGSRLKMRYTPILTFYLDESVKKSMHISELIDRAVKSDEVQDREGEKIE